MSTVAEEIRRRLLEDLPASSVELEDLSDRHRGHPGATSGGGHYRVCIVSEAFEGVGSLDRHRKVYEALGEMMGSSIHAISMETLAPSEIG